MDSRHIGPLVVSAVGLGCNNFGWHLDEAASRAVVHAALDAGVTHFDTADVYGEGQSEAFLGRALGARRSEVVVATKFGNRDGAHPETVARAAEDSLRRLGTDTIDLYTLHKPDPAVPIADTLGALSRLVEAGKVREVACSNLSADQLREADEAATGARFVALQSEYSLLHRAPETDGTLDACRSLGLAFVPYFPLKSGLLSGKYRKGSIPPAGSRLSGDTPGSAFAGMGARLLTDANLDAVERLTGWAESRGGTALDLAFAYLLAGPAVASVIAGATRPEQVAANVAAAGFALSETDLDGLDTLLSQPA